MTQTVWFNRASIIFILKIPTFRIINVFLDSDDTGIKNRLTFECCTNYQIRNFMYNITIFITNRVFLYCTVLYCTVM